MAQIQEFLEAVAKDTQLQQELMQAPSREAAIQLALAEAPKLGYNITQEDVEAWEAEIQAAAELNEEQLDAVAGGVQITTGNRGRY